MIHTQRERIRSCSFHPREVGGETLFLHNDGRRSMLSAAVCVCVYSLEWWIVHGETSFLVDWIYCDCVLPALLNIGWQWVIIQRSYLVVGGATGCRHPLSSSKCFSFISSRKSQQQQQQVQQENKRRNKRKSLQQQSILFSARASDFCFCRLSTFTLWETVWVGDGI